MRGVDASESTRAPVLLALAYQAAVSVLTNLTDTDSRGSPPNVAVHCMRTARKLCDVQVAVDLAPRIDPSAMLTERRVRHAIETDKLLFLFGCGPLGTDGARIKLDLRARPLAVDPTARARRPASRPDREARPLHGRARRPRVSGSCRWRGGRCWPSRKLGTDPRPAGARAVSGQPAGTMRLRVGNYRVVYVVEDDRIVVTVVRVGHRSEVFRDL